MHRVFDGLERGITLLVILALAGMVLLIGVQVSARYLVNQPLHWTEEAARHLMIWMFFLAAVIALRRGAHLSIDLLPDRLPPQGRLVLRLATSAALAVFLGLMMRYGWDLTLRTMGQRASALSYPMGYVYAALPVSGGLMFLVNVENAIRALQRYRSEVRAGTGVGDGVGEGWVDR